MSYNLKSPLGNLPIGWHLKKLSEVAIKIGSGSTPRGGESAYIDERIEFAFLRSQNVLDFEFNPEGVKFINDDDAAKLKGVHLRQNDVLLNITGDGDTFSRCCIVPVEILPAAVNQHVAIIRLDEAKCLSGYLLAYLCLPEIKEYIASFNAGGSRRAITKAHIESFEIPLAPIKEQERIQSLVFDFILKIKMNAKINQTLEQMAQALFKSWFVDFEPVKAKITALEAGCSQAEATLAAMTAISGKDADALAVFEREHPEQYAELKATAELFPSAMQVCELGEIPEGWYQTLLSEFTRFLNGHAFKSKDWREAGFPVVKIGSVKPSFVDLKNCSYIDGVGIKNLERFEVFPGDILVGMTGYPGETGIIPDTMQRVFLNQRVGKFIPLFEFLYSYIYTSVRNASFKIYVNGQAHGSAQANISGNDILQYPVVKPNDALLRAFDVIVRNLISLKLKNQAQIQSLEQLRDTLLPKLLSGEITLPEAEQAVSEAENV